MVIIDKKMLGSGNSKNFVSSDKKIGLCHGCFDILHFGHVKHFEEAKTLVDLLIVSITSDEYVGKGAGRPFFDQELRAGVLEAIKFIDIVAVNQFETAESVIQFFKPNLYIKGPDYRESENEALLAEIQAIRRIGGDVHFTSGVKYSSTELFKALYSQL